jgi:hypothetical protein
MTGQDDDLQSVRPAGETRLASAEALRREMPERLRSALDAELCPGERLELVVRPNRGRIRAAQWSLLSPCAALSSIMVARFVWGPWPVEPWAIGFWVLMVALTAFGCIRQRRDFAYILTDQRCFRLSLRGRRVQVVDTEQVPTDFVLDHREITELDRRIRLLRPRLRAGRARAGSRPRPRRELPAALRESVQRVLRTGESVLWADRPHPWDYFLHARMDGLTVLLMSMALGSFIATLAAGTIVRLPLTPLELGAGFLGLVGSAMARLLQQVRGTVYALTDQRGFVLAPGGQLTEYAPADLRRFHRTQNTDGRGNLAPPGAADGEGFYGVRNVKVLDDLIKERATREHSTEVAPSEPPAGRGDELSPAT